MVKKSSGDGEKSSEDSEKEWQRNRKTARVDKDQYCQFITMQACLRLSFASQMTS